MMLGNEGKTLVCFGGALYAIPIGEHFYRIKIYTNTDSEIIVTLLCGGCYRIWEENYKTEDTVNSTVKCPNCGLEEEIKYSQ